MPQLKKNAEEVQLPPDTMRLHSAQGFRTRLQPPCSPPEKMKLKAQSRWVAEVQLVGKLWRNQSVAVRLANHDAHDTCGPVHVVSSLRCLT